MAAVTELTYKTNQEKAGIWQPMMLLNLYRLTISLIFIVAVAAGFAPKTLGAYNREVFWLISVLYLALALIYNFTIQLRSPRFTLQVHVQLWTDLVCILILMYASGGVASGLGMLLIPTIAGGSLLLRERFAMLYAAVASIVLLVIEAWAQWRAVFDSSQYTQTGLLGGSLLITALIAVLLARSARTSEALAAQRGVDLANLAALNAYIVQRLDAGLLVVDPQGRVRFLNAAARRMLAIPQQRENADLASISVTLANTLREWRQQPFGLLPTLNLPAGGEALIRISRLGRDDQSGIVISLDEARRVVQQVQQMKLASLGRLSASIAHEVRNPLGAINHAAQLLEESEQASDANRRLISIIRSNAARVNDIVESVMQISRRSAPKPEAIDLEDWLHEFIDEFVSDSKMEPRLAQIEIRGRLGRIYADKTQLRQVLWNLCQNVLQHCVRPSFRIEAGITADTEVPYVDVVDRGPKIDAETADQMFEPFFTTKTRGTGLGLYVSRELCECNEAHLSLTDHEGPGNRFRISFSRGAKY